MAGQGPERSGRAVSSPVSSLQTVRAVRAVRAARVVVATLALASPLACSASSGGVGGVDAAGHDGGRDAPRHEDARKTDTGSDASRPRDAGHTDVASEGGTARTVTFGPGLVATLGSDGQLTVTSQGSPLLGTARGTPLFATAADPANPDGFHDPKALAGERFDPLAATSITMESPAPGLLHLTAADTRSAVVLASLALAADDGFYTGLGERYDHVDPRGQIVGMQLEVDSTYESGTTDRHVPVPWLVSSHGYGVFVADRQAGAWDVARTEAGVVRATFEGSALDVTVAVDEDPLEVVAALTRMTGLPRATPTWALAPMMWRHVDTQAELLGDLAHIRALHIPTTTFWIDDGWQVAIDTLDFDPAKYSDAASLGASMRALGFRQVAWNSPYLHAPSAEPDGGKPDEAQALYPMAAAKGYFVEENGAPFQALGLGGGGYGLIDFTSSDAQAFWVVRATAPVGLGLDGFKLDYGEDMVPSLFGQRLGLTLADGETERTARTYPLAYHGAYRQALAARPDGGAGDDGILVVRASTYGGGAVADILWPGDLDNGFQHYGDQGPGTLLVGGLPASIVAAQTSAASGFALYGADTGGYRDGAPTKESLLRWAEHTALSMVMQLGPGENKYPWNYDADTVTTYTALAALHQRLVPYLATLLAAAETHGTPTLRPLPLAYPTDGEAAAHADDEYLLGPSLLVAPVTTAGATSGEVHLPPGSWFSYWAAPGAQPLSGPVTMTVSAPLGQPPLFVLAGSLLPLLPDGVDTLVDANDPSTVSLSAMAGRDVAAGWVRGAASAVCLDGSEVSVADDASGVLVTWTPKGTGHALDVTLDLAARTGTTKALTQLSAVSGAAPTDEPTVAAVLASGTCAYHLAGDSVTLHLASATAIRLVP